MKDFGIPVGFTAESITKFAMDVKGASTQEDILQEECAELISAISKYSRGRIPLQEVAEEMTHVAMSMSIVAALLGVTDSMIKMEMQKKIEKHNYQFHIE